MVKKSKTAREKELIRRYLIWCYKTTKEDLDRIDRYFTQFEADTFLLKTLRTQNDYQKAPPTDPYRVLVAGFETYMKEKKLKALKKKFLNESGSQLEPQYRYLRNRFGAVEKAIVHFLGKKELTVIGRLYEEEMTTRILTAREHN